MSHYFDSDPTKLVAGLREDGRAPAAFIADTTTANAQVRFTEQAKHRLCVQPPHGLCLQPPHGHGLQSSRTWRCCLLYQEHIYERADVVSRACTVQA